MTEALSGLRVWITRPVPAAAESVARWAAQGALARAVPTVALRGVRVHPTEVAPLSSALRDGWVVLTSANAARFFADAVALHHELRALIRERPTACVGTATANAARAAGYNVQHVAERATGADLARELVEKDGVKSLVLPGSDLQRPEVELSLRAHGCAVRTVTVYETAPIQELQPDDLRELRARRVDAVALYSPSAAAGLTQAAAAGSIGVHDLPVVLALGPTTAVAAEQLGLTVAAQADQPGEEALLAQAARWWAQQA